MHRSINRLTGFSSVTSQPRYSATFIIWLTMQSISCRESETWPYFIKPWVHRCTNFPKIKEPPLNYRNHKVDLKQLPCWGLINFRFLKTKFSCLCYLAWAICAPLFETYFKYTLWGILCILDCSLLYWFVLMSQGVLSREITALQHRYIVLKNNKILLIVKMKYKSKVAPGYIVKALGKGEHHSLISLPLRKQLPLSIKNETGWAPEPVWTWHNSWMTCCLWGSFSGFRVIFSIIPYSHGSPKVIMWVPSFFCTNQNELV